MKRIFFIIFLTVLVIGLYIPNESVFANGLEDDYLNINLTKPIKSNNLIRLYSEDGFGIYKKDNILNELEYLNIKNINITLGDNGEIIVLDPSDNVLLNFNEEDDFIFSSINEDNRKIKVEDNNYRGFICFKRQGSGLSVINYLKLEDYLYGVVPREMPASFPMEALKAQAIAARTYTLKNINKHGNDGFSLCDTTHCQVYGGMDGEQERTNNAVDETKGKVITYNGEIIDALYHSNSGGFTEDSAEAWGNSLPYLTAVNDKYLEDLSTWTIILTPEEINTRLKNSGINIGKLVDMKILETSTSGRVSELKVIGTLGEEILSKSSIRQILGTTELKSTLFTIKRDNNVGTKEIVYAIDGNGINSYKIDLNNSHIIDGKSKKTPSRGIISRIIARDSTIQIDNTDKINSGSFIIEGKGYGHGVGMSQWGAKGMAESGYTFDEILKHYYTGIDIINQN